MTAQKGNKYALKLKDRSIRKKAFDQYCEHLSKGYPSRAFSFEKGDISITGKTMESYVKNNPEEFPEIKIEISHAKSYKLWFERGRKMVEGEYKNCSPITWQTVMRNIFKKDGWDASDSESKFNAHEWAEFARFFKEINPK